MSNLYSPKTIGPQAADKFPLVIINILYPAGKIKMDTPLKVGVLLPATKSFRSDSTPGSDGLPAVMVFLSMQH